MDQDITLDIPDTTADILDAAARRLYASTAIVKYYAFSHADRVQGWMAGTVPKFNGTCRWIELGKGCRDFGAKQLKLTVVV